MVSHILSLASNVYCMQMTFFRIEVDKRNAEEKTEQARHWPYLKNGEREII